MLTVRGPSATLVSPVADLPSWLTLTNILIGGGVIGGGGLGGWLATHIGKGLSVSQKSMKDALDETRRSKDERVKGLQEALADKDVHIGDLRKQNDAQRDIIRQQTEQMRSQQEMIRELVENRRANLQIAPPAPQLPPPTPAIPVKLTAVSDVKKEDAS